MRLAAVATARNHAEIAKELLRQAGPEIETLITLGDRRADYKASSLLRITQAKGQLGHVMDGDRFGGLGTALTGATDYETILLEAMDTLQRGAEDHHDRPQSLRHPDDYGHYTAIIADRLAAILSDNRIDTVLFFDVPHLFYDSLLYRVACAMGLRTLILRSSFRPGYFFSMERIEDLGHLDPARPEVEPFPIARDAEQEHFYMKGIGQDPGAAGGLSARALGRLLIHIVLREPGLLVRPARLARTLRRMHWAAARLPQWRDPFARFFGRGSLDYAETIAALEDAPVDLDRPFVYFALQLQPEMTTSILGGRYRDQALAIEHLAAILPDDHLIYVKENPKQGPTYRSAMFFHRQQRIGQVRLMPSHANTHALTRAASCVATISGTVAWEAICAGRSALIFGDRWMQDLPGVHRFRPGLRFADVVDGAPDHAALERAAGRLMAASHEGVISRHVARIGSDHDEQANADKVASVTLDLLRGRVPPSFVARSRGAPT